MSDIVKQNPIPADREAMSIRQLKECADLLGRMFDGMARNVPADNMIYHLDQERARMLRDWNKERSV